MLGEELGCIVFCKTNVTVLSELLIFFDLMNVLSILNVRQTQSECRLCALSLASDVEISICLFIEGSLAGWELMMMVVVLMMMG